MARLRFLIAALALLSLGPAALADLVHLNTGGVIKGEIVGETDEAVQVKTAAGVQTVRRDDIDRIERGASAESAYEEGLKKLSPTDAEGHYRLGVYLRKLRLEKEARSCFERALKIDPNHLPARIALAEGRDQAEALVASIDEGPQASDAGSAARRKLPPDLQKTLDGLKKEARALEPERRAAAWEKIRALHAGAPSAEAKEAILASVATLEQAPRKLYERNARRLAQAIPDYDRPEQRKARDPYREAWEEAAAVAIGVIFDLKIYPDENHGKVGQPIVDEKVEAVRAAWPAYDQLVTHDLARFSALGEEQAKTFAAALERSRALLAEALAGLEALGAQGLRPLPDEPPAAHRALLLYRAGRIAEALALRKSLSPWEARLLDRLRDLRVEAYNDRMGSDKTPPAKGKRPNGEERKQVAITNQYRMLLGRPALEIHPCLVESARGHSQEMTQLGYFEHESPVEKNRTPSDRARNAGYPAGVAENISLGSLSAQATHDSWYNSSPHHRNILGLTHKAMGSGLDGQHWTQNFGDVGDLER